MKFKDIELNDRTQKVIRVVEELIMSKVNMNRSVWRARDEWNKAK